MARIPVVYVILSSCISCVQGGILSGIGRGYSDFTAALVSAAVQADAMQVR